MEDSEIFTDIKPFTGEMPGFPAPQEAPGVLAEASVQREIAEVQTAMVIAKRFPRNQAKAIERILIACQRSALAEGALYSYSRGGTDISGPSIRLAEAIAQQWGNLQFGIREIEQRLGESTVEAYAWDLETNTRQRREFQVRHIRYTKKGTYSLSDPRDIYEMVANQGARRLRACILGIVPGDVVEAAVNECESTLKAKADIGLEAVKKMLTVFEGFGVSRKMIEARIQRNLESITAAQIISLRKIYNSLKDGMSTPADWFAESEAEPETISIPKERKPRSDKGMARKSPDSPQEAPAPEIEGTPPPLPPEAPKAISEELMAEIREALEAHNIDLGFGYTEVGIDGGIALKELDETSGKALLAFIRGQ
jgi:hypothetical protein